MMRKVVMLMVVGLMTFAGGTAFSQVDFSRKGKAGGREPAKMSVADLVVARDKAIAGYVEVHNQFITILQGVGEAFNVESGALKPLASARLSGGGAFNVADLDQSSKRIENAKNKIQEKMLDSETPIQDKDLLNESLKSVRLGMQNVSGLMPLVQQLSMQSMFALSSASVEDQPKIEEIWAIASPLAQAVQKDMQSLSELLFACSEYQMKSIAREPVNANSPSMSK